MTPDTMVWAALIWLVLGMVLSETACRHLEKRGEDITVGVYLILVALGVPLVLIVIGHRLWTGRWR